MTEIWYDHDDEAELAIPINTQSSMHRLVRVYIMFIFTWQSLFRVSDSGMNVLLLFFAMLFGLLVSSLGIKNLDDFIQLLPRNITAARKVVGHGSDIFLKYASCPVCHSIYPLDSCKIKQPDKSVCSRKCSYIRFPQHRHALQRSPCNVVLMKKVRTSSGTTILYPRQLYCYHSLIDSLKDMVRRPGFVDKCELWRTLKIQEEGTLTDIYDGKVWKDFMNPDGKPFLSVPYNFALSLNVDWFQPFKHTTYSAGAIYIAIQNLPRNERYSNDNVLLIGIIPGPNEPPKTMNSYLQPLVCELKELWKGVIMPSACGTSVLVRSALICTSCDIPASRKVSGFVGHNAYRACSRCLKAFPTNNFGEKPDYCGTDRDNWIPRCMESHRYYAQQYNNAKTFEDQKKIEREHGCRYSILLELPYYNVIRFCVIDPMHNLLLGTAKRMMSVWISTGIIDKSHYTCIQEKVDAFITPTDIGRIPSKIASGFSSFTAEQWRNWTLIYSLCSLKGVVPHRHYDCWLLFVKATHLLCSRQITVQDLDKGDTLLMEFCQVFEQLYGKQYYTINLHLHGHLKECILDFGPVYSFWLFSFERLNGVLGSYHTNGHDISVQLMRRFTSNTHYGVHNWPAEYKDQLSSLLFHHHYQKGSLQASSLEQALQLHGSEHIDPLPPVREAAWEIHQKPELQDLILSFIGHQDFTLLTLYDKATALSIGGYILGSTCSRFKTKSHVMAIHPKRPGEIHLARIEHFANLDVKDNGSDNSSQKRLWAACVNFYYEHDCKVWFGHPTQVWSRSTSPDFFYISLSSIKSRVAYCESIVDFGRFIGKETVYVVSILSNCGS